MPAPIQRIECLMQPPIERAAYSDRTAWLMAVLAKLSYLHFETNQNSDKSAQEKPVAQQPQLEEHRLEGSENGPLKLLEDELQRFGFKLIQTFNVEIPFMVDTQGYLCQMQEEGRKPFLVLAFRGTEFDKIADQVSNFYTTPHVLDAKQKITIHSGFWQAYSAVEADINSALQQQDIAHLPLYISGHSLGGALAIVAAYRLEQERLISACYTYGSPRVGNFRLGEVIKTPIYRHVHASDLVPRLPPSYLVEFLTLLLRWLPIIPFNQHIARFFEIFRHYRHFGDMRYLSAADAVIENGQPQYPSLQVLSNPSQILRWIWLSRRWIATLGKAAIADHNMDIYLSKLAYWAQKRNL